MSAHSTTNHKLIPCNICGLMFTTPAELRNHFATSIYCGSPMNGQDTTNHEKWVSRTISEGGANTTPFVILPEQSAGRRWRVIFEELIEDE
jgi:hypothetical protein